MRAAPENGVVNHCFLAFRLPRRYLPASLKRATPVLQLSRLIFGLVALSVFTAMATVELGSSAQAGLTSYYQGKHFTAAMEDGPEGE